MGKYIQPIGINGFINLQVETLFWDLDSKKTFEEYLEKQMKTKEGCMQHEQQMMHRSTIQK